MSPSISSAVVTALTLFHCTLALPAVGSSEDLATHPGPAIGSTATSGEDFSVKQTRNTRFSSDGSRALASVYRRFDVKMPENLAAAVDRLEKRDSRFTSIWGIEDKAFLVRVMLSRFQQPFKFVFDLTSAGVWALSKKGAQDQRYIKHLPEYSTSAAKMEGYYWAGKNLNGKFAFGDVYQDEVSIGTIDPVLASKRQAIQLVDTISQFDYTEEVAGIIGMAFSSRNLIRPEPQLNFFDNVVESLDEKVFTVDMKHGELGTLEFNTINTERYIGDIGYSDVLNEKGLWNFTIGGLISDTAPLTSRTEYAMADTVSSLILLPMQYNTAYYKQVPGCKYLEEHALFIFPCDSTLPDFTFEVGDVPITIPGNYLTYSALDDEPDFCFGVLQPSNELGFNVLGTTAFKSAFVVFDPVSPKIGWAKKPLSI
ncbi:uncharacterized protein BROUX77_002835 [Berkeleyomyces rouxiae]|uniref:uncharacterized protein n=1 Tax=Berkeleyomyces rouxiae TaxID=2035830 RepID=UPI003B7EB471